MMQTFKLFHIIITMMMMMMMMMMITIIITYSSAKIRSNHTDLVCLETWRKAVERVYCY